MAIAYEIQKAGQAALEQIHSTFSELTDLKNSSDQLLLNKTISSNTYSTGNYTSYYLTTLTSGGHKTYAMGSDYPEMITVGCKSTDGYIVYSIQGQKPVSLRYNNNVSTSFEIFKPYAVSAALFFTGPCHNTIIIERLS